MADYTGKITVDSKDVIDVIDTSIDAVKPIKTSQLTNDSGYVTTSGSVASADTASSATNLTGTSGVTAGSKGPTADVSIATNNKTGSIKIPKFVVNAQGLITSITEFTLTVTSGCSLCSYCSDCSNCSQCSQCSDCSNCSQCNDCNCQP